MIQSKYTFLNYLNVDINSNGLREAIYMLLTKQEIILGTSNCH